MTTVTRQVEVQLGQETIVDVKMAVQGVSETVNVIAAIVPAIEKDSTALKSGVSSRRFRSLPVGQEYRDLIKLIPGVQYTAGRSARPERRRQRPGQRLQVRRRQRDAAALSARCRPSRRRTTSRR